MQLHNNSSIHLQIIYRQKYSKCLSQDGYSLLKIQC
nr:MAG TPA: hypothetical protein [Caudoviricetes sp.]